MKAGLTLGGRVSRVAGAGGVVAKLRAEGEARLDGCDGGESPSADAALAKGWHQRARDGSAEGQVVAGVDGGEVADVCGSRAPVERGLLGYSTKAGVLAETLVFHAEPSSRLRA